MRRNSVSKGNLWLVMAILLPTLLAPAEQHAQRTSVTQQARELGNIANTDNWNCQAVSDDRARPLRGQV